VGEKLPQFRARSSPRRTAPLPLDRDAPTASRASAASFRDGGPRPGDGWARPGRAGPGATAAPRRRRQGRNPGWPPWSLGFCPRPGGRSSVGSRFPRRCGRRNFLRLVYESAIGGLANGGLGFPSPCGVTPTTPRGAVCATLAPKYVPTSALVTRGVSRNDRPIDRSTSPPPCPPEDRVRPACCGLAPPAGP